MVLTIVIVSWDRSSETTNMSIEIVPSLKPVQEENTIKSVICLHNWCSQPYFHFMRLFILHSFYFFFLNSKTSQIFNIFTSIIRYSDTIHAGISYAEQPNSFSLSLCCATFFSKKNHTNLNSQSQFRSYQKMIILFIILILKTRKGVNDGNRAINYSNRICGFMHFLCVQITAIQHTHAFKITPKTKEIGTVNVYLKCR